MKIEKETLKDEYFDAALRDWLADPEMLGCPFEDGQAEVTCTDCRAFFRAFNPEYREKECPFTHFSKDQIIQLGIEHGALVKAIMITGKS